MNPARVRDLNREGEAVLGAIEDIPVGHHTDLTGHLDAKRRAKTLLRTFLARLRNELPCGEPATPSIPRPSGRPIAVTPAACAARPRRA